MKAVDANPIPLSPYQIPTRKSTSPQRPSTLKSLLVSILLLIGLGYGMCQVYVMYTFYDTVVKAGTKLERMLDEPYAHLQ
ncbi:MAG: hypothetical protein AAFN81_16120 [Bacteroidota bacterium]